MRNTHTCDFIFNCLSIYLTRILSLLLLHIDNIRTLSENIKFLSTRFKKVGRKASLWWAFLSCFAATMYVYCVYPAMSEIPKQLPNYLKIVSFESFLMISALMLLLFLIVALHKSGTRKLYLGEWQCFTKQYPVNAIWLLK
jgi:hypothetical protein